MADITVDGSERPLVVQATGADAAIEYDASDFRALFFALARDEGMGSSRDFVVTPRVSGGANMSVDVSNGVAVVNADATAVSKYIIRSATSINVPGIPATPSGTRTHRLIAEVIDVSPNYIWRLRLMMDTGGGTPAEPVATATTLALISVPAGISSITAGNINAHRKLSSVAPPPLFRGAQTTDVNAVAQNYGLDVIQTVSLGNTDFPEGDQIYVRRIPYPGKYRLRATAMWYRATVTADIYANMNLQVCNAAAGDRVSIWQEFSFFHSGYCNVSAEIVRTFIGGEYVLATTSYNDGAVVGTTNLVGGSFEIQYLRQ